MEEWVGYWKCYKVVIGIYMRLSVYVHIFACFLSSQKCQTEHWRSGHKSECNDIAAGRISPAQNASSNARFKTPVARKNFKGIALVPTHGIITKRFKQPKKV